jgi:site-specific recombinase XerD
LKINRITTARIEKFIVDRQNQGMNISTIKKILVTLGQIMTYAVRHKYIDFNPALKAAGLSKISFHDLRHTYASLLTEQGENIKYIQSQLNHSSPRVTLNIYAHLMKPVNQEAACRLENTIFETSGSKMAANNKKEVLA